MARAEVGTRGTPNKYTRWYASKFGRNYLNADWCAIFVSWAAEKAGVRGKTGTFALTTSWANWYASKGRWRTSPRPGDLVFIDWAGGKSRTGIDHVGIVVGVNKDGSVSTIEGNASNAVQRATRSPAVIVGYGRWGE